jgi:tetratricopeptide (TPR) repeat protein
VTTHRFHKLELEPQATTSGSPSPHQQQQEKQIPSQQFTPSNVQLDELHDSAYWMKQADQSRRSGLFEEALKYYSRAVELDRSIVAGWVGQVQMLIALEEFSEAELWARKALELFRNHVDLNAARAQALCRNGDLRNAQASCDAALAQPGQSAYPWMVRGDLMLARKDPVEQHCFDKAIQLDPDWLVLIEIAATYQYYRRHAKALARCRQATEKAPDRPYCWYVQGVCEMHMGLKKPARLSLKQCLDLEPKHQRAREALREVEGGEGGIGSIFGRLFGRG